jgi:hypothetical protein
MSQSGLEHLRPLGRRENGTRAERRSRQPSTLRGRQRVPFATAQSFSDSAAEWTRRLHRIAPNQSRIGVDLERTGWGAKLKVGPAFGEERL